MARTQITSKSKKTGSQTKTGIILPSKGDNPDDTAENMSGAKTDFEKGAQGKKSPAANKSHDKDKWTDGTVLEDSEEEGFNDWF